MFNRNKTGLFVVLSLLTITSCNRYSYPIRTTIVNDESTLSQNVVEQTIDTLLAVAKQEEVQDVVPEVISYDDVEDYYDFLPFTKTQSAQIKLSEYNNIEVNDLQVMLKDMDSTEFCYPAPKSSYVTSPYGWRKGRMHSGIDLKVQLGEDIYAAFDGVVRMVEYNRSGYGYYLVIRHFNGLETLYSHASKILVEVNQRVKAGDVVALGGRTGRATGTHLHFEVRLAGQYINPNLVIDTDNHAQQPKNLYLTTRKGKLYASNDDDKAAREAEILSTLSIQYHVVKSGDVLGRIASRYGSTVSTICRLNNIKSNSTLRIGQRLVVRDGLSVEEIKRQLETKEEDMLPSTTAQDMYGSSMIVKLGKDALEARESVEKMAELRLKQERLAAELAEQKRIEDEKIAKTTTYYTVRKGDMLSTIASKNGTTVSNLCNLNGITTRSKLQIGQKLIVARVASESGVEEVVAAKASSTNTNEAVAQSSNISTSNYTIKSGDILATIASRHNTTVATLCNLNGITTSTTLYAGRTLKVPASGVSEQSTTTVASREYTVKSGDVLGRIAVNHNTTVSEICSLNGITTSSKLKIGQKLKIPTGTTISSNEQAEYYTVKSGDVLSVIAENNNTTVSNICNLNGITSRSTLKIGQKLRIR